MLNTEENTEKPNDIQTEEIHEKPNDIQTEKIHIEQPRSLPDNMDPEEKPERISIENVALWFRENKGSIWRVLGVMSASGCFALTGSTYAFNAFANAVKESFQLTQYQVEVIASLSNFGVNFSLIAIVCQNKFGPKKSLCVGIVIVVLFYLLLWSTQYDMNTYIQHSWVLYIYFFMTGFGAVFGYLSVYAVTLGNFRPNERGRVVSVLEAFYSAGSALFAAIYGAGFVNGFVNEPAKQNIWGYFMFTAIAFLLVYGSALLLVQPVPLEAMSESSHLITAQASSVMSQSDSEDPPVEPKKPVEEDTICKLFSTADFHLIFWPFVLSTSIQLMFMNNIPAYLKSFNLLYYNTLLTVLIPMVAVVAKLVIGVLVDVTLQKIPRVSYAIVCNALQSIFLLISALTENFLVILITGIAVGLANGAMWLLSPVLTADRFGVQYFSRNWGFMIQGCCLGGFALQAMFGALYDVNADAEHNCYGKKCFVWSFVITAILSTLCTTLNVVALVRDLKSRRGTYNQIREE